MIPEAPMADRQKKTSTKAPAKAPPKALNGSATLKKASAKAGPAAAAAVKAKASGVRTVCVYCGSGPGTNPAYVQAADILGRDLANAGIGLVYGGGGLGLMGQTARAVLAHGGRVTGIIPQFLSEKERMLKDVHESIVTKDMHERKKIMYERSDAFVALPGGIGTLEELVEQLTWAQLGRHNKPIVLANIDKFWDPFLELLAHMRNEAFIRSGLTVRFVTVTRAADIVPAILAAAKARGEDDPAMKAITTQF
jgi:uncharacterized protein (TIGR00730 family)